MATSMSSVSLTGVAPLKARDSWSTKSSLYSCTLPMTVKEKSHQQRTKRNLSVCAEYNDSKGGNAGDFVVGLLLGGAIFGTLGYVFAPQIRRTLLNEDEYGFRRARRPIYYDEGLEKTRETLNSKISQLNSAIDNVSSRLRGGKKMPPVPVEIETDEATM